MNQQTFAFLVKLLCLHGKQTLVCVMKLLNAFVLQTSIIHHEVSAIQVHVIYVICNYVSCKFAIHVIYVIISRNFYDNIHW